VYSALNTSQLIKTVKSQAKTIDNLTYQNDFIGNLFVNVTDEAKDQVMSISGQRKLIEDISTEKNEREILEGAKKIEEQLSKITRTFEALNFVTSNRTNLKHVFDTVAILTKAKSSVSFKIEGETLKNVLINCEPKFLVYILSEIALYLYKKGVTQTEIIGEMQGKSMVILINKSYNYDPEFIKKLNSIVENEENININVNEDGMMRIIID
jgi:hypothetical protein